MAKTTPEPVGAWPAPIPFGEATAAVWLDGSMASAAIAHWLTRAGARWTALLDDRPQRPERARSSARALAESLGDARVEGDHATDVHGVRALAGAARHHLVDLLGIELGAVEQFLDDHASQLLGGDVLEGTAEVANRGAHTIDHNDFSHGFLPFQWVRGGITRRRCAGCRWSRPPPPGPPL